MSELDQKILPKISSLAAPTAEDFAVMRSLSEDDRRAIIADHIAQGTRDIAEGRYTTLESDEDIKNFFAEKRAKYETSPN